MLSLLFSNGCLLLTSVFIIAGFKNTSRVLLQLMYAIVFCNGFTGMHIRTASIAATLGRCAVHVKKMQFARVKLAALSCF